MNKFISAIFGILACVALLAPNTQARPQFGLPSLSSLTSVGTGMANTGASALTAAVSTGSGIVGTIADVASDLNPLSGSSSKNETNIIDVGRQAAITGNQVAQDIVATGAADIMRIRKDFQRMMASWGAVFGKIVANSAVDAVTL